MKRYSADKKWCKTCFASKLISLRNLIFTKIKLDKVFRPSKYLDILGICKAEGKFGKNLEELTHGGKTSYQENWQKTNGRKT